MKFQAAVEPRQRVQQQHDAQRRRQEQSGFRGGRLPDPGFQVIALLHPAAARQTMSMANSFVTRMRAAGRAVDVFGKEFAATRRMATSGVGDNVMPDDSWPEIVAMGAADPAAVADILAAMKDDPCVRDSYVAPPRSVLSRASDAGARRGTSERPPTHWGMDFVTGDHPAVDAQQVLVGVVDSGVDKEHPDLKEAVVSYQNFTGQSDRDTDGHGTHVCGIIAGRGVWPSSMAGVSNARLVVCKGMTAPHNPTAYYRALRTAAQQAKIVNLSVGGPFHDQAEAEIIAAAQKMGVLFVAAMGNDFEGSNEPHYPAALEGVIAVGAVDDALEHARFSNTGKHITVTAPGVDIWSTVPTYRTKVFKNLKNYAVCEGTSMAAPFVAGVAAILYVQAGQPDDAASVVARMPFRKCAAQTGWTEELGHGLVTLSGQERLGAVKAPKPRRKVGKAKKASAKQPSP